MKPSIILSAEQNWPEDEASLMRDAHQTRVDNGDYTQDELEAALAKDRAHMHRVFGFESDGPELIRRFELALGSHGLAVWQRKALEKRSVQTAQVAQLASDMSRGIFRERHAFAFSKLREYAADDQITAERLAPFLAAQTLAEAVKHRAALEQYLACTVAIDAAYTELSRIAEWVPAADYPAF